MKDVRENEQLNTELLRHDEIFKALAELSLDVKKLSEQVNKYEPMFEYFNKGSIVANAILFVAKWSGILVISLGSLTSAYIVIKQFLHGQN